MMYSSPGLVTETKTLMQIGTMKSPVTWVVPVQLSQARGRAAWDAS